MLEDSKIRVFNTVVQEGNFTKAARLLGISQPAVSQNIAELEKLMGCQLFDRSRSSIALTSEGRRFKEYADQISYWCRAAEEAFSPALPKALRQGIVRPKTVRVSVPHGVECRLLPQDAGEADVRITQQEEGVQIALVLRDGEDKKKQRDLEGSAAGLWDE